MSCDCSNKNCTDSNSCLFQRVPRKASYQTCERDCVNVSDETLLKMSFVDDCENPVDPSAITLAVTKPNAAVDNFSLVANTILKADVGFYYIRYTPDIAGDYSEAWEATINGTVVSISAKFEAKSGGKAAAPDCGLEFNSLLVLELDETIADVDGNTLGEDKIFTFSTEYNPFYASVEMLRMEVGPWVNTVPDDTIALAIHWSSLEADHVTGVIPTSNKYDFARSRFVMYDAAIKLLTMPISSSSSSKKKQLGDLLIDGGGSGTDYNLDKLVSKLSAERAEWWRVINAGGCINPGQGLGPVTASKGGSRRDANNRSREWHDPWGEYFIQPSVNSRYRRPGETKEKLGFTRWNEYYFTRKRR